MVCPYCNNRSVPNAVVCNHCGVILKNSKALKKAPKPLPLRRLLLTIIAYVLAIAIVGTLGYIAGRFLFEPRPKMWLTLAGVGALIGIILVYLVSTGSYLIQSTRLNNRRRKIQNEIVRIEHDRERRVEDAEKAAKTSGIPYAMTPEERLDLANEQLIDGRVEESLQQLQQVHQLGLGGRVDFLNNAAVAFGQRGQTQLSIDRSLEAMRADTRATQPRVNLLYTYLRAGDKNAISKLLLEHESALKVMATDESTRRRLALAYAIAGNATSATQTMDEIEKSVERDVQADLLNDTGIVLALAHNHKEALADFQQAAHLDTGHAQSIGNAGALAYRQRRYEDAVERCDAALRIDPHNGIIYTQLGAAHCRINQHNEGIRAFREARTHQPYLFEPHYNLGKVYIEQDAQDQAERHLVRAHEINPFSWQTLVAQAVLLFKQSMMEKSHTIYRQALQAQPEEVSILGGIALCTTLEGNYEEGEKFFKRAVAAAPDDIDLLTNFSWHYLVRADTKEATALLERVMEINRKAAIANNNMGLCQMEMGAYDAAMQYFKQALQSDSSLITVHYNLGNDYISQKAINNAIDSWEKAKKVENGNADLHTNLGVAYYRTEKFEKSGIEFRRVLHLRQERSDDYVNLGLALARMKKHKEAIEQFDLGIQIDPRNPMIHSNRGLACYFANQVEEAMQEWRLVTQISSQYAKLRGTKQQSEYDDSTIDYVPLYISERALYTQPKVPDYAVPFAFGYATGHWELMIENEELKKLMELRAKRDRVDRMIRALKD